MFELARASCLAVELLTELVEQLRQAGIRSRYHPTMSVIHDGDVLLRFVAVAVGEVLVVNRVARLGGSFSPGIYPQPLWRDEQGGGSDERGERAKLLSV